MNTRSKNLILSSSLSCPYTVVAQDIGTTIPAFNVGVAYPLVGGYNVPFASFSNSQIDLSLIRKLAAAYQHVASQIDPHHEQPQAQTYEYQQADHAAWLMRCDHQPCSSLPNTFWGDEPDWKFHHGGLAWEMYSLMTDLASAIEARLESAPQATKLIRAS